MPIFQMSKFDQQRFMFDVKSQIAGQWRKSIKDYLHIMRFRHNEVNFEAAFDVHQKTLQNVHKICF